MPFSGGVYSAPSLPGSFNPAISGQDATPDDWNTLLADLELALSTCWTVDGQSTITANQPLAGFKFTNAGEATLSNQYATLGQVQSRASNYAAAGGTADTITITPSPVIVAYAIGQTFSFKTGAGANTTAVTLNVNGVGAGAVVGTDGSALAAGELQASRIVDVEVVATTPVFQIVSQASTAATQSAGNSTTKVATTAFVGAAVAVAAGKVYQQVFTGSGTYTPHAGMVNCIIECVGGGGGGGGIQGDVGWISEAAGGGSGSYSRLLATAATIGASKAVTIGALGAGGTAGTNNGTAGGDTSVGTLCIAKGGSGGQYTDAGVQVGVGGLGGVAGTGDFVPTGNPGGSGWTLNSALGTARGAPGGASHFQGAALAAIRTTAGATAGGAATNYGGGGGGGVALDSAGTAAGGAGAAGVVIITEYCNQ